MRSDEQPLLHLLLALILLSSTAGATTILVRPDGLVDVADLLDLVANWGQ